VNVEQETPTQRVLRRVAALKSNNESHYAQRLRMRDIMNGGEAGLKALIGDKVKIKGKDIPTANLILSGMERLGQELQDAPDLKVDYPEHTDSDRPKEQAEKRRRIVEQYDSYDRLELQVPQAGRWLPGYGFSVWTINQSMRRGQRFPSARLRNPLTCWPGQWGEEQDPHEVAFTRIVPKEDLARMYPEHATALNGMAGYKRTAGGGIIMDPNASSWESGTSTKGGVEVIEYIDIKGTYICIPVIGQVVRFIPNPLEYRPPFKVAKRFAFDALIGQFDHVVGLMAMLAKLNVLSVIAAGDAVFRETNIIGDMISKTYKRGRNQQNFFTPGTRIEKAQADVAYQVFQEVDRIERQLRITQNYPVNQDGISPMSFTTGEGVRELAGAAGNNIKEYQKVLRYAFEDLDSMRLEWDEAMYGDTEKPLDIVRAGTTRAEKYIPSKHINGQYRTRRVYGMMASWDEPSKIVGGLQLMQAEALDVETFQENLTGLDNIPKINERIGKKKGSERLLELLTQEALQGNPQAKAALVELTLQGDVDKVVAKYFRPEDVQPTPEELQAAQGQGELPPQGDTGQPPPPVTTVLSQLGTGGTEAGVQTVGRL